MEEKMETAERILEVPHIQIQGSAKADDALSSHEPSDPFSALEQGLHELEEAIHRPTCEILMGWESCTCFQKNHESGILFEKHHYDRRGKFTKCVCFACTGQKVRPL